MIFQTLLLLIKQKSKQDIRDIIPSPSLFDVTARLHSDARISGYSSYEDESGYSGGSSQFFLRGGFHIPLQKHGSFTPSLNPGNP